MRLEDETVWLSQQQIAELFQSSRTNIVQHLRNIYGEGELDETATCRKSRQIRTDGNRQVAREIPLYNLDLISCVACGREHETRLGEVRLSGDALHCVGLETGTVKDHRERANSGHA